jgi:hypothetical protein
VDVECQDNLFGTFKDYINDNNNKIFILRRLQRNFTQKNRVHLFSVRPPDLRIAVIKTKILLDDLYKI